MPDQPDTGTHEDSGHYPSDLLAQRLNLISDFVDQACTDFHRHPAQSRRMLLVFTAVLGGLTHDLQSILTPELDEKARREIEAAATAENITLSEHDRDSSARLLAGIWGTGVTEGVTAQNWQTFSPGLASACLQVARLTGQYAQWNHSAR
ncbi:hypothetical protein [Streptomyces atriruber]|uniref:hypothetical protein n=1 Tax=Streptomyces atriruber TaxID=545121 RepID=UPI0006E26D1C|nr:hypothetical protein [Streptomyces atriruber]